MTAVPDGAAQTVADEATEAPPTPEPTRAPAMRESRAKTPLAKRAATTTRAAKPKATVAKPGAATAKAAVAKPGAAKAKAGAAKPKAAVAKPAAATAAKPADGAAPPGRRPKARTDAAATTRARAQTGSAAHASRSTPPAPAPQPGAMETAVQAAAELAEIGLQASARALRRTLSRLPRP